MVIFNSYVKLPEGINLGRSKNISHHLNLAAIYLGMIPFLKKKT